MSQTTPSSFAAKNSQNAKALDYAFVIAGWPTIYTVAKNSYTPAGDLANFSSIQAWANIPDAVGVSAKGRPEEGSCTIAQIDVDVLDRVVIGKRSISDLLSRQAYVQGASPGVATTLIGGISNGLTSSTPTISVASTTGFPSLGNIYIGLECIHYTGTTSTTFTGCTRGYLLTSPTPHGDATAVYSFMPSIYRRRAFLYKGYQNLGLDQWAPAFGGAIVGASKSGAKVTFSVCDTMWLAYANGEQVLLGPRGQNPSDPVILYSGTLPNEVLSGDFSGITLNANQTTNLGNGHYLLKVAGHWMAVTSVT